MKTLLRGAVAFLFWGFVVSLSAREVRSFNTEWQFKRGPFERPLRIASLSIDSSWTAVTVPHTWNAEDMQVASNVYYEGEGYYCKTFAHEEAWTGKRVFLRFEGVGSVAEVYLNGKLIAAHRGGYSAFAAELTKALVKDKPNVLVVKADNKARPDVIPVNQQLFGIYGGIYRPVWLIVTEPSNIIVTDCASPGVYITQGNVSARQADVTVKTKLDNGRLQPESLTLETVITDADGKLVASDTKNCLLTPQGAQTRTASFTMKKPHLWQGRKDPYLYRVSVRLKKDGRVIDEVVQPLGLRNIEIVAGKGVFLNGEKYPMYGVTRHQDWWGLGSALDKEQHDADLAMIMDIGATTIRLAHYQQSDYFYARCDSLGLLVWAEIPFVNRVTGQEWENCHEQLRELIRQSFNHPAIYIWGLHNEVYTPTDYCAALTASLHDLAKTEDPNRYTASVNGYGIAEHAVNQYADVQGMNRYFGWYEKRIPDIVPWVEGLEKDYPWQRLMLTEYGADANIYHQTELIGDVLNWGKPYYPETFQTKTHEYHWSVIARHPYIVASYLWNMFDFACPMWTRGGVPARNMKGLVTFDRKIRKDSYYWYKANWSADPVVYLTQRRNTDRERRNTSITVYSNIGMPAVTLNGAPLSDIKKGYTDVHYIMEGVTLVDGENVIRATVTKNGKTFTDEIRWNYAGEKDRSTGNVEANPNEHVGF